MKDDKEVEEEKPLETTAATIVNDGDAAGVVADSSNGDDNEEDRSPLHDLTNGQNGYQLEDGVESHTVQEHIESDDSNEDAEDTTSGSLGYDNFSKTNFVDLIKSLAAENDFRRADAAVREIKPMYDELRNRQRSEALNRFKQAGGVEEDFDFKGDEDDAAFDLAVKQIRDKRTQYYKSQEEQKISNLKKKEDILVKLRALAESEDTEHSLQAFKQLQNEWKSIGAVAPAQSKTLWANFGALVDRFYDQRSIYFELKELDRRKNLELKLELCDKAEKLVKVERVQQAVRELNDLHNDFKHIGPVPKEEKETIWQRFKAASDAVYAKRDKYLTQLASELQENLSTKNALGEDLTTFATFQSDRIKEWNQKTQDILALQKKWEAVGPIPRAKSKDINKKFWASFKGFFNNKSQFFKRLDEGRDRNLAIKMDIIRKANELKESKDWDKTANDLKDLQNQWREVGPVQEKFREKLFQEFKAACDHFFEQRRSQHERADREQEETLKQKEAICCELEKMAAEKSGSIEQLNILQTRFNGLGFVPKRAVQPIKNRFNDAVNKLVSSLDIPGAEKEKTLLGIQLNGLKHDPQADVKIYHKEQAIRKRITKMENDVAVLRNNLEFFGRSKNAEKMKEEFNAQIVAATEELDQLKNQLKMLKTVSS